MINKQNVLGKTPVEAGIKDAVHTAIVSVRAAETIPRAEACGINEYGEGVIANSKYKAVGVADPFTKGNIARGQVFWLVMNQDEVSSIRHDWDHEKFSLVKPTRDVVVNQCLSFFAKEMGVTYEQLMEAANSIVDKDRVLPYPGNKTKEEMEEYFDNWDEYTFWSEWADEVLYEFDNIGTECCPEYDYPGRLFKV